MRLLFSSIIIGMSLLFVFLERPEMPHVHVETRIFWANGIKSVPVTICLTDSSQVDWNGRHVKTELSESYFK
jgi:hypothetical protein